MTPARLKEIRERFATLNSRQGDIRDLLAYIDTFEKDRHRLDWMCDSYGAAGMDNSAMEDECLKYERIYFALKREGKNDRESVRAAIDAARQAGPKEGK